MNWFKKAQSFYGSPSMEGLSFYAPEKSGEFDNVYQSSDFPHVFLGGKNDIEKAQQMTNEPICRVIDVSKHLPEHRVWNQQEYQKTKKTLIKLINVVAATITSYSCPIYIHCQLGANRSVSVVAAAIAKLTGRSVMDVLSEIKTQRGMAGPDDAYLNMISQHFEPNEEIRDRVRSKLEIS